MRQLIVSSLAAGMVAVIIGCGSKPPVPQPAPQASDTAPVADVSAPKDEPAPLVEDKTPADKTTAKEPVTRIEATWESKVHYQPQAQDNPAAVVGHMRLFTAGSNTSCEGDGEVTVILYDDTPQPGNNPGNMWEWTLSSSILDKFRAENSNSPEYLFALPLHDYKPTIEKVHFEMKYVPKRGKTLMIKTDPITLDHSEMKDHVAP